MSKELNFETLQIHGGTNPEDLSCAVPIFQTAAYTFKSSQYAADLFSLKEKGYIYTRIMNPTQAAFEDRVNALEGGVGALAVASGQAAVFYSILTLAKPGDEIISTSQLYGGTYNLFANTLPRLGIKVHFIDGHNPEEISKLVNDNTKAVYGEIIGNPGGNILDIEVFAKEAHSKNLPLIIDATLTTPYISKPFQFGADIVLHSATKYIGGHGTSIGGIIVDCGKFDWGNGRFPEFTEPDPSYNGVRYHQDIGEGAYITKARVQLLRDLGACISPFNAFLLLQGLETLSLRMEAHCSNALKVAQFLSKHPLVEWVNFVGLEDNKYYPLAKKYLKGKGCPLFTFGIKGGLNTGSKFIDSVRIFSHAANLGDAKSLVIHPASTTHQQLSEEARIRAGVSSDLIRISVGIENIDDLINDLDQALQASQV
jgi:O-acetylhomoserine (thiol)-lyase